MDPRQVLRALPLPLVDRMARMSGWAYRLVLAYLDADPVAVRGITRLIADYDASVFPTATGFRYTQPTFHFPMTEVMRLISTWESITSRHAATVVTTSDLVVGAQALVRQCTPAADQKRTLGLLEAIPQGEPLGSWRVEVDGNQAADLHAVAAAAAWIAGPSGLMPAHEQVRLLLMSHIRQMDATIIDAPDRETLSEISDEQAFALLEELFDKDGVHIPRDPAQRGLAEHDVIAMVKQRLLTHDGLLSAEHRKELISDIIDCLTAALATTGGPTSTASDYHQRRAQQLAERRARRAAQGKGKKNDKRGKNNKNK